MLEHNAEEVGADDTQGLESYAYAEWAIGGINRRNDVRHLDVSPNVYGREECYRSVLRFTEDLIVHKKKNGGSVGDYAGPAKADFFPGDFDHKDLAIALEDAQNTIRRLETNYDVPPEALRYFFSGGKGFHVEIPKELFGGLEGGANTAFRLEVVARVLLEASETADFGIYQTGRLWRRPDTKNKEGGLFKVELTPHEFLNLGIEEILEIAREPRGDLDTTNPEEFGVIPELERIWRESENASPKDFKMRTPSAEPVGEKIPEGQRNSALASIAGSSRRRGLDAVEIYAQISVVNQRRCEPPLPEDEVREIAKSVCRYAPEDSVFQGVREEGDSPGPNPLIAGLENLAEGIENGIEPPEELEPGILLKGRVTHLFAPAAVGKTYLALYLAARSLERGESVLYLDSENGKRIIAERLEHMGVPVEKIRTNFNYLPFPSLDMSQTNLEHYLELIEKVDPVLIIFDSLIKFLSSAGLEENENDHIAKWATNFVQPLREAERTILILDHVPHDGTRSRGASRKRDEVDVQYRLVRTQSFDRATTGEVRLNLEKDREGWLPQSTTFSIGGGEEGFVFERSDGTVEEGPGSFVIKTNVRIAFDILVEQFGLEGARYVDWWNACKGKMSKATFDRARDELVNKYQWVSRGKGPDETKYYPKKFHLVSPGGETKNSPYISGFSDMSHDVSSMSHETAGSGMSHVSHTPVRGETMRPTGETSLDLGVDDERLQCAKDALIHGNAPKKALEHYQNGDQDIDSVVRSVMHYCMRERDDPAVWKTSVTAAVAEIEEGIF